MSLQNLQAIGQLQAHQPDAGSIAKLLQAARRNPASTPTLQACVEQATRLLAHAERWLRTHRPDLLSPP